MKRLSLKTGEALSGTSYFGSLPPRAQRRQTNSYDPAKLNTNKWGGPKGVESSDEDSDDSLAPSQTLRAMTQAPTSNHQRSMTCSPVLEARDALAALAGSRGRDLRSLSLSRWPKTRLSRAPSLAEGRRSISSSGANGAPSSISDDMEENLLGVRGMSMSSSPVPAFRQDSSDSSDQGRGAFGSQLMVDAFFSARGFTLEEEIGGGSYICTMKNNASSRMLVMTVATTKLAEMMNTMDALVEVGVPVLKLIETAECSTTHSIAVMDIREAEPLSSLVRGAGLPIEVFMKIALPLTKALGLIHERGVVHRRICPKHIWVDINMDWAVAVSGLTDSHSVTSASFTPGFDPLYMAPECTGRVQLPILFPADMYSLGATFYEMITGRPPFTGADDAKLIYHHRATIPEPVSTIRQNVPQALSEIVSTLLEKDADARYPSVHSLHRDLDALNDMVTTAVETGADVGLLSIPRLAGGTSCTFDMKKVACVPSKTVQELSELSALFKLKGHAVCIMEGAGRTFIVNLYLREHCDNYLVMSAKCEFGHWASHYVLISAIIQAVQTSSHREFGFMADIISEVQDKVGHKIRALGEPQLLSTFNLMAAPPKMRRQQSILTSMHYRAVESVTRPTATGSASKKENEVKSVVKDILEIMCRHRPVVLFLDDIEHADPDSVQMVDELIQAKKLRIMVIISHSSDNDTLGEQWGDPMEDGGVRNSANASVLSSIVSHAETSGIKVFHHLVPNLTVAEVTSIVAEALRRPEDEVIPLANVIFHQTQGHAINVNHMLLSMYQNNAIRFSFDEGKFVWASLPEKEATDISSQIAFIDKLEPALREILTLLTFFKRGLRFAMLFLTLNVNMSALRRNLLKLGEAGILLHNDGRVSFVHDEVQEHCKKNRPISRSEDSTRIHMLIYRGLFWTCLNLSEADLEDINEAMSSMNINKLPDGVSEDGRPEHLDERIFLSPFDVSIFNTSLLRKYAFMILRHANMLNANDLTTNELVYLSAMGLHYGVIAYENGAYEIARDNFYASLRCMSFNDSDSDTSSFFSKNDDAVIGSLENRIFITANNHNMAQTEMLFRILTRISRAEMKCGSPERAVMFHRIASRFGHTENDQIELLRQSLLIMDINKGKAGFSFEYVADTFKSIMTTFDLDIPLTPAAKEVEMVNTELESLLEGYSNIDDVVSKCSRAEDEQHMLVVETMASLLFVCFDTRPRSWTLYHCQWVVRDILKHGVSEYAGDIFSMYGMMLCVDGNIGAGMNYVNAGVQMCEVYGDIVSKARCYYMLGMVQIHGQRDAGSTDDIMTTMSRAQVYCTSAGFFGLGSGIAASGAQLAFASGVNLQVQFGSNHISMYHASAVEHPDPADIITSIHGAVLALTHPEEKGCLGQELEQAITASRDINSTVVVVYYTSVLVSSYIMRDDVAALAAAAELSDDVLDDPASTVTSVEAMTYLGLVLARGIESLPDRETAMARIRRMMNLLHLRSAASPGFYKGRALMLEGELLRLEGKTSEALRCFNDCVEHSNSRGLTNHAAIASELAYYCFVEMGMGEWGQAALGAASGYYSRWGAVNKADALSNQLNGLSTYAGFSPHIASNDHGTRSDVGTKPSFDQDIVMRATQAITSELRLDKLLEKMVEIVKLFSGAQIVSYILKESESDSLRAGADIGEVPVDGSDLLEHLYIRIYSSSEGAPDTDRISLRDADVLCMDVVKRAVKTNAAVLVNDASGEGYEGYDKTDTSIMCFPVKQKNTLKGLLYAENRVMKHSFAETHLELLSILSSQMAMVIDNALLYEKLQLRSQELEDRNRDLKNANEAYARFVPREFCEILGNQSATAVSLGDHREMEMSVLFLDIRDFTEMAEELSPAECFSFLNEFTSRIGPVIRKRTGFIDKYIGDCVMALFAETDHASDALLAAMEMSEAIDQYNETIRMPQGKRRVEVGIGINSGPVILGTVGEKQRMDSTVIADAVNTASRVEGMCKVFDTRILVTNQTFNRLAPYLQETIKFRHIGLIEVKGKCLHPYIYEVIVDKQNEKLNYIIEFEKAVSFTIQNLHADASYMWELLHTRWPNDAAIAFYTKFCKRKIQTRETARYMRGVVQVAPPDSRLMTRSREYFATTDSPLSWDFNVFKFSDLVLGRPLYYMGLFALETMGMLEKYQIPDEAVRNFMAVIDHGYWSRNAYHNSIHGADVVQGVLFLMKTCRLSESFSSEHILACILAAIVHDFHHPGVTNPFLSRTQSELLEVAEEMGATSILENFHLIESFHVLENTTCAFLAHLEPDVQAKVKSYVSEMVFATDLSRHKGILEAFDAAVAEGKTLDEVEPICALQMIIKVADVSNPGRTSHLYHRWVASVMEEFWSQGDMEKLRGLELSPYMDRENPQVPACQVGFIQYIGKPQLTSLNHFIRKTRPDLADMLAENLANNLQYFQDLMDKGESWEYKITPRRRRADPV